MSKDLKSLIVPKIKTATVGLINDSHSRVKVCDFDTIQHKQVGQFFALYHPVYANKYLEYFNDEEYTDFLIFENNKVYIDYSDNLFTFHKIIDQEKVLVLDLDNQEIKETEKDETNEDNERSDEGICSNTDLITLSYFPLCISHCNITLCYEQDLPQVLSSELLVQFLQLYQIEKNNSLVCGYDSLGAGCVINHLHFEFLMLDDFSMNEMGSLPIAKVESFPIMETKLKHKNEEEISLFDGTTLVKLSKIKEPIFGWKIECITKHKEDEHAQQENLMMSETSLHQNSISHVANVIMTKLIDGEIPHNLIIGNLGTVFYLFPRQFEKKEHEINSCWNDIAGFVTCKHESVYNEITEEKIKMFFKDEVSIQESKLDEITNAVVEQISSVYEVEKF